MRQQIHASFTLTCPQGLAVALEVLWRVAFKARVVCGFAWIQSQKNVAARAMAAPRQTPSARHQTSNKWI
jgi:hypothetical protein